MKKIMEGGVLQETEVGIFAFPFLPFFFLLSLFAAGPNPPLRGNMVFVNVLQTKKLGWFADLLFFGLLFRLASGRDRRMSLWGRGRLIDSNCWRGVCCAGSMAMGAMSRKRQQEYTGAEMMNNNSMKWHITSAVN